MRATGLEYPFIFFSKACILTVYYLLTAVDILKTCMQLEIHQQTTLQTGQTQKYFVDFKLLKVYCCAITLSASLFSDVTLLLLLPSRPLLSCRSSAQHGTTGDAPLSFHLPITYLNLVCPRQLQGEYHLI